MGLSVVARAQLSRSMGSGKDPKPMHQEHRLG
jgi:hypothetical protein